MPIRIKGVGAARISSRLVVRWAKAAAKAIRRPAADMAIVFVGSKEIRRLNAAYRRKPKATDVLSFPADRREDLGDIFIAPAEARKKAAKRGMSYRDYLQLLVVHSILHLGGYDHHTEKESRAMEKMEKKILGCRK
jgi:probable rRNA maturation factor